MTSPLSTCRKRWTGSCKVEVVTWAHGSSQIHLNDFLNHNLWPRDSFCVRLWCFIWSYPLLFLRHPPALQPSTQALFEYLKSVWFECRSKPPSEIRQDFSNDTITIMRKPLWKTSVFCVEFSHNIHSSLILQKMHKYFTLNSHIVQLFSVMHAVLLENQEMFRHSLSEYDAWCLLKWKHLCWYAYAVRWQVIAWLSGITSADWSIATFFIYPPTPTQVDTFIQSEKWLYNKLIKNFVI